MNSIQVLGKMRDSNIELLRIIAMLMIVFSHSTFSVINEVNKYPEATNTLFQYLISGGGKIGINIFMLISGYFMCQQNISFKKFVRLLVWVYFYDLTIGAVLLISGLESLSFFNIIDYVFPFRLNGIDYFTTAFLFFYISIPFWRIFIDHLDKRQHFLFILFGYVCYVIYNDIPIFEVPLDAVFWFGYLYVIASYIRRYVNIDTSHMLCGKLSLVFLLVIYASIFFMFFVVKKYPIGLFSSANSTLALGFSITTFIWFKGLKIKNSSFVNMAAGSTFGVLLIHSGSSSIRNVVWNMIVPGSKWFYSNYYIIYMILAVLLLYVVCTFIDIIYKKTFENRLIDFVYTRVDRFYHNIKELSNSVLHTAGIK